MGELVLELWSPGTQLQCSPPLPPWPNLCTSVELCLLASLQTGVRTGSGKQTTPRTLCTCFTTRTRSEPLGGEAWAVPRDA